MSQLELKDSTYSNKPISLTDSTEKTSHFLKRLRRRSKTYSGEELATVLNKKLFVQNTTKKSESGLKPLNAKQSR
jgi:hypothetical protein